MSGATLNPLWRVRALSAAAAFGVCFAVCALLVLSSRSTITERGEAAGVEVFIAQRETIPAPPRRQGAQGAPVQHAVGAPLAAAGPPSVDTQMLQRMLSCARRPGQRPRDDCPREPAPEDWRRPQLAVGGDFVQPPEPDMNQIYTRAELQTLVMPSCVRDASGGCMRIGTRPPPPSRSAEQICEDGGLGGPCRPPPEHQE